ncbi:MAG TPA: hypothetical protein VEB43_16050, partial [Anaeromyxobacter sp.]|nr:hypothetical protein [Anaeromyxobacter sp.]
SCLDPAAQVTAWERTRAFPALGPASADPRVQAPVPFLGGQVVAPAWREASRAMPALGFDRIEPVAAELLLRELEEVVVRGKAVDQAIADARAELARRIARQRR